MTHMAPPSENEPFEQLPVSFLANTPLERLVALGKGAIERAASFEALRELRNKAEALRMYQRAQGASALAVSAATQLRLRADRRMGEALAKMEKATAGRPPEIGNAVLPISDAPTYAELGIGKMQASRWQRLAAIPEDMFAAILERHECFGVPVTTASVVRTAERANEEGHGADDIRSAPSPSAADRERAQKRWWAEFDGVGDREIRRALSGKSAERIIHADGRVPDASDCRILHCSLTELFTEAPESVDAIVTDPPYPEEFLPLYGDLGRVAMHLLKPGGVLLCMTGQTWFGAVFQQLHGAGLEYQWQIAYLTPGGQAVQIFPRKVNSFWKPVLVFSKGGRSGGWFGDVARSNPNDNDKTHHHWGQSESGMHDLMRRFVLPGQVVCDPFLGGGTTALVALALGASFLGCDVDRSAIQAAKARLASADLTA